MVFLSQQCVTSTKIITSIDSNAIALCTLIEPAFSSNSASTCLPIQAIVDAFEGYSSLHTMSFADKRRVAKLMGEVVHKKSNDELHNLLAPWFRYAKENHQCESVADLQGTN